MCANYEKSSSRYGIAGGEMTGTCENCQCGPAEDIILYASVWFWSFYQENQILMLTGVFDTKTVLGINIISNVY